MLNPVLSADISYRREFVVYFGIKQSRSSVVIKLEQCVVKNNISQTVSPLGWLTSWVIMLFQFSWRPLYNCGQNVEILISHIMTQPESGNRFSSFLISNFYTILLTCEDLSVFLRLFRLFSYTVALWYFFHT